VTTGAYNEDQLQRFLAIVREKGGMLRADQMRALLAWDKTPASFRDVLADRLHARERYAAARKPELLRSDEER
jgi:hypothetical protein